MGLNNTPVYQDQYTGVTQFAGGGAMVFAIVANATLAEVNAGKTLIAGVAGFKITVVNIHAKSNGTFAALTAITVSESDGSPLIVTYAQAQLADAARFNAWNTVSGQTVGAGFGVELAAGNGVTVQKTGSTATTATSIDFIILYMLTPA